MIDTIKPKSSLNHQVLIFLPSKVIDKMDIIAATFELIRIIGRFPRIFIPPKWEYRYTPRTFSISTAAKAMALVISEDLRVFSFLTKSKHNGTEDTINTGIKINAP